MNPVKALLLSSLLASGALPLLMGKAQASWNWEGDAQWFSGIGCQQQPLFDCLTNMQNIEVKPKAIHTGVVVTGMAAGMDTTARLDVQRRECSIGLFTRNCSWVNEHTKIIPARTWYKVTLKGRNDRIIRLTPTAGESRVHLGVGYIPAQTVPPSQPKFRYQFCGPDLAGNLRTYDSYAPTEAEALALLKQVAGIRPEQQMLRGPCQ